MGKWEIASVDIYCKPEFNQVVSLYYPVPITNKDNFQNELTCLV